MKQQPNFLKKYNSGLVLGKFMPPHKGHEYMIRFAQQYVKNLYVIIDKTKNDAISLELRKLWLEEEISGIHVITLDEPTPQDPSEHPDFWNFWKNTLLSSIEKYQHNLGIEKQIPEVLVASMDYGWPLAKALGCDFIQSDIARTSFPVSATQLRENIFEKWDFLIDSAKAHFAKKVCFVGPESTGKSVCAQKLAQHFKTIYVPEYAKAVISSQQGEFFVHNVPEVIQAQINSEKSLAKFSNKLLICDSDAITTQIYAQELFSEFKKFPLILEKIVEKSTYDLTFLFKPDIYTSHINDVHRNVLPDELRKYRDYFFMLFEKKLQFYNRKYIVIEGNYEERFEYCKNECLKLINII